MVVTYTIRLQRGVVWADVQHTKNMPLRTSCSFAALSFVLAVPRASGALSPGRLAHRQLLHVRAGRVAHGSFVLHPGARSRMPCCVHQGTRPGRRAFSRLVSLNLVTQERLQSRTCAQGYAEACHDAQRLLAAVAGHPFRWLLHRCLGRACSSSPARLCAGAAWLLGTLIAPRPVPATRRL